MTEELITTQGIAYTVTCPHCYKECETRGDLTCPEEKCDGCGGDFTITEVKNMKLYIVTSVYPECLRDDKWKYVVLEVLHPGTIFTDMDRAKASCQEEVDGLWKDILDDAQLTEETDGKPPQLEWKRAKSNNYSLKAVCEDVDVIFNIWTRTIAG